MSCCPAKPEIQRATFSADEPQAGPEPVEDPEKPFDCTLAKSNTTTTGSVADKTEPVPEKIVQTSIVTKGDGTIDMTFRTTGPTPVTSWVFTPPSFASSVTGNAATGRFSGTFADNLLGQRQTLSVEARGASGTIDKKTYTFSPVKYDSKTSLKLVNPLPGAVVTSAFGNRKPPTQGASSMHGGVDFAYPGGRVADCVSAADGEIVAIRTQKSPTGKVVGYGNYVIIHHKGPDGQLLLQTLYAHLDSVYVAIGQKVSAGQAVGKEGNTGTGTGKHLHFETRLPNGTKVDPTPYLNGGVSVANTVKPDNTPDETAGTRREEGDKGLTRAEVKARQTCVA